MPNFNIYSYICTKDYKEIFQSINKDALIPSYMENLVTEIKIIHSMLKVHNYNQRVKEQKNVLHG